MPPVDACPINKQRTGKGQKVLAAVGKTRLQGCGRSCSQPSSQQRPSPQAKQSCLLKQTSPLPVRAPHLSWCKPVSSVRNCFLLPPLPPPFNPDCLDSHPLNSVGPWPLIPSPLLSLLWI